MAIRTPYVDPDDDRLDIRQDPDGGIWFVEKPKVDLWTKLARTRGAERTALVRVHAKRLVIQGGQS